MSAMKPDAWRAIYDNGKSVGVWRDGAPDADAERMCIDHDGRTSIETAFTADTIHKWLEETPSDRDTWKDEVRELREELLEICEQVKPLLDLGFNFEGDVYGVHNNEAGDAVSRIESVILRIKQENGDIPYGN